MNRTSFRTWRPATKFMFIGGLVLLFVVLVSCFLFVGDKPGAQEVRLGSATYYLWVADNEAERVQGLSGVEHLDDDGGLLMKFDTDNTWGIWMKDMLIPLDIVWLNSAKEVVYIVQGAKPETATSVVYAPEKPARYVVELPEGSVQRAEIAVGEVARFDENAAGEYRR